MRIPDRDTATKFLMEAERLNPGNWVPHSLFTAQAAEVIAKVHPELDSELAYVMGYLHDIGRRAGITYMRHSLDGYHFLQQQGYDDIARICITHTFWLKHLDEYPGKWDCSEEEIQFLESYITSIEYNEYDWLIQLCDCLALPTGFCLLEKRLVDVALRYGTTKYTAVKWNLLFENKVKFEQKIGRSIYDLLPGVRENTFS
ncbi:HD domain-containing protein [Pelosinus baikalensis]|uniref:HD domain-containing protein n=1 Tax=Pelosinus baikalensis TaxID=2892015 RepID=A0ABS8I0N2_9FIRM|nr:HD domain-containing protein [Pelosinus baikalensis]MCC5467934.1 HD domain-containing protein [Pelosinus baikalensis]